jgi:hypothetical protein
LHPQLLSYVHTSLLFSAENCLILSDTELEVSFLINLPGIRAPLVVGVDTEGRGIEGGSVDMGILEEVDL